MKLFAVFSFLLVLGFAQCQQEILDKIPLSLGNFSLDDGGLDILTLYAKDFVQHLKEKCLNATGSDEIYSQLEEKRKDFQTYLTNHFNFTVISAELTEAKKTGSMDEVFAKYCALKPEALQKFRDITETFKQCLPEEEHSSLDKKANLTEKMLTFFCEKDGDKIAMFIANGGEDCIGNKSDSLYTCLNLHNDSIIDPESLKSISLLEIDEQICEKFPEVEECVVTVLEECKIKTPANIVGALFKFLKKNMDCPVRKEPVNIGDGRGLDAYFVDTNRIKRSNGQIQSVTARFQEKCQKNAGNPQAFNNLNASFTTLSNVFISSVFEAHEDCLVLKRNTELRLDMFLVDLKICLSPQEDFLPNFLRNAVAAVFDYLCENNGRKLLQYRRAGGLQCLQYKDTSRFHNCAARAPRSSDRAGLILKQTEFCDDVQAIRKCIKHELIPLCEGEDNFKEISLDLLKTVNEKCSGCSLCVNTIMIIGLVLLQLKTYLF